MRVCLPLRHDGDAEAEKRGIYDRVGCRAAEATADLDRLDPSLGARIGPDISGRARRPDDALVPAEVAWPARPAKPLQIGGCGDEHPSPVGEMPCCECRVRRMADADGNIQALVGR